MENIKISYSEIGEKKEESEDAVENIFAIFIAFFAYVCVIFRYRDNKERRYSGK